MSDSDSENLSDLEQEEAVSIDGSDGEKEDVKELGGELNDIEETDVKWSDLVSLDFSTCFCFLKHVFLQLFS